MKKLFTLIAALVLGFSLNAQTITDEEVIVSPESIHLYFHGCSPHGERVSVTNHTSEDLVINRCYAESFIVEFLYEGENIAETGFVVPIGESVGFEVYATPTLKQENDIYGTIFIDTDFASTPSRFIMKPPTASKNMPQASISLPFPPTISSTSQAKT